jgi:hypothetical protein
LQVTDSKYIEAAAIALVLVAATTGVHYEAVRALLRRFHGLRMSHARLVRLLLVLVLIHGAEVGLYAGAYAFGADVIGIGGLAGGSGHGLIDFSYFAAETYSTLGYGDLVPTGGLRVIACVEAINGVLLLTLSGAFLSGMLRDSYLRETRRLSGSE